MSDPFASAQAAAEKERKEIRAAQEAVLARLGAADPTAPSNSNDLLKQAEAKRREKREREMRERGAVPGTGAAAAPSSGPPISPTGLVGGSNLAPSAAPPHALPVASVAAIPPPPGLSPKAAASAQQRATSDTGFFSRVTRAVMPGTQPSPSPLPGPPHAASAASSAAPQPQSRNNSAPAAVPATGNTSGGTTAPLNTSGITDAHGNPVDQATADMILAARLQEEEVMHAAQAASFEDDNNAVPAALPYGTSGTTAGGNANLQAHEAIPVAAYAYPAHTPPQQQPRQPQAGRSRWNPANWFSSSSPSPAAAAPPPRYYAPGATQPQQQYLGSGPILIDPVWGPFTPQPPGSQQFTPMQMCGISCCPCCVPPMCIPARKEAWKRFCRSANFILAVFQTIIVIISIALHGFSSSNSMWGPSPATLNTLQGKNSAQIVYNYQLWRLVTPIALHAGLLHLAMNMLIQLRLGVLLEYQWGVVPYLWIYLGSGVCGSVYSAIFNADAIGVGASGALLGVFGAWMSHMFLHWRQGDEAVKRQRRLNFWMAIFNCLIIIAFSFSPLIDWAAHIGGLGGGILLGFWYFGRALDGQVDFDFPSQSAQMAALSAPLSPNNSHHNNTRRLNYVGTTGGGGATATCCRAGNGTPSLWTRYCATSFNCSKEAFTPCTKGKGAVWFGVVGYFVVLVAGLLGLFFNTTPSRALLNVPPY